MRTGTNPGDVRAGDLEGQAEPLDVAGLEEPLVDVEVGGEADADEEDVDEEEDADDEVKILLEPAVRAPVALLIMLLFLLLLIVLIAPVVLVVDEPSKDDDEGVAVER